MLEIATPKINRSIRKRAEFHPRNDMRIQHKSRKRSAAKARGNDYGSNDGFIVDSDAGDDTPLAKRAKTTTEGRRERTNLRQGSKPAKEKAVGSADIDDDGNTFWEARCISSTRPFSGYLRADAIDGQLDLKQPPRNDLSVQGQAHGQYSRWNLPPAPPFQYNDILMRLTLYNTIQGISMPMDQYSKFMAIVPEVEVALKAKGEEVVRPIFESSSGDNDVDDAGNDDGNDDEEDEEKEEEQNDYGERKKARPKVANGGKKNGVKKDTRKKNFEATSEEDDDDDDDDVGVGRNDETDEAE